MVDDTQGRDTTADSVMYNPGDTQARDVSGNFVDIPPPVTGPSVDKEELTEDNGEVTKLVEEQEEDSTPEESVDPVTTGNNDGGGVAEG